LIPEKVDFTPLTVCSKREETFHAVADRLVFVAGVNPSNLFQRGTSIEVILAVSTPYIVPNLCNSESEKYCPPKLSLFFFENVLEIASESLCDASEIVFQESLAADRLEENPFFTVLCNAEKVALQGEKDLTSA
jgi:hypothetical protein